MLSPLENQRLHWIPISALAGDNVVKRTQVMPWYTGPSILECLESIPTLSDTQNAMPLLEIQGIFKGLVYGNVLQGTINLNKSASAIKNTDWLTCLRSVIVSHASLLGRK